jgi:hypothetical protein
MKYLLIALLFPVLGHAQSTYDSFSKVADTDSLTILNILKGFEENDQITLVKLNVYTVQKGYQRVFVWWTLNGRKLDYTRGVFTLDKTQAGVTGYSMEANKKHPKAYLLEDSEYISSLLEEIANQ